MSTEATETHPFPVKHGKVSYYTAKDGQKLRVGEWGTELAQPKGKLVFNHGFTEHIGVFDELFKRMVDNGYYVLALDQRGAGEQCQGKKYGITNETFVYEDLNGVIKEYLVKNNSIEQSKKEKLFIWGHSMGGGIALNYGVKGLYRDHFTGFIGCAPLVQLHPASVPNFILRGAMEVLARAWPTLHFPADLKMDYIVSNPDSQKKLEADEWIRPMCTVKQMYDMFQRGNALVDPDYVANYQRDAAVLIYHSEHDKINWYEASKKFIDAVPVKDKQLFDAKGCEHSIHLEQAEKEKPAFDTLINFLDEHTKQ
ncbi:Alpha/Beta hydrolase protein [Yarrowia lipolytica]|jgi:acylglycerol lipase|uniref:YALI0C14520p n=2 Tax=Yarrowia lipolytica TaxID=4952 RepID=Q6CBY1_YARLI|nr:YALI0C14520p [Yarrowia lipolytica CLIB122]AOW02872.1 hypothetical protein YALI1_C20224g [Yarrowia lipolytica]KAB8280582.1 Alpha/Beta hydrolase protein [Yarrowia lipolytica]KAE8169307.1 Alpha/Beta hydrolase protein [Yarrowia lipolytica]KAJ8053449.1 Alpha/Beta hydrolase protein [Yarrowia lipolytica]QNP95839.1 Monoglyceride lipase [Yarrowia lipolytica]|eukprot:XP_501831.1 YALI0C14520p [Yarrowia lipolytica CLIB122]